jgi:hypothetical protein
MIPVPRTARNHSRFIVFLSREQRSSVLGEGTRADKDAKNSLAVFAVDLFQVRTEQETCYEFMNLGRQSSDAMSSLPVSDKFSKQASGERGEVLLDCGQWDPDRGSISVAAIP